MDFFSEQDQARRSSKVLVSLFLLSVLILIVLTNVLVAVSLWLFDEQLVGNYQAYQQAVETMSYQRTRHLFDYISWQRFLLISAAVSGVIACAIGYKWLQLSGGGKRVAEQLGGQRIDPNTSDSDQKKILNVVEEMAIASGMPVPSVYLLADEMGINAFAAGSTPADAVIGVTRGCIEQFDRQQLQGVIAHEFSHILNGDMRLNIRLIAILHGILFIGLIGRMLLHGNRSRRDKNSLAALGFGLIVIGGLGQFFGSWIKSAVGRQREFLADASAVQFTRNPTGIANALKIIGGYQCHSQLQSSEAEAMSHLFFGQALNQVSRLFASHPPLEERIRRIEPSWDGQFIIRKPSQTPTQSSAQTERGFHSTQTETLNEFAPDAGFSMVSVTAAGHGFIDVASTETIKSSLDTIPGVLRSQAREPFGATALIYGLLLSDDLSVRQRQLQYIALTHIQGLENQTIHLMPVIQGMDLSLRLPLIELALPALKCMSAQQYQQFRKTLLLLIRADNNFELFEWCLYQLVHHYLDTEFGKVTLSQPKYKKVEAVADQFQLVLSLLAHHGDGDDALCAHAFGRGANAAGLYNISLLPINECKLDDFIRAVNQLANCYPLLKPRLLKSLQLCANHDGNISVLEKELISAIAAVMDCPMPRLL